MQVYGKLKESLIVIPMVQTLYTSVNILLVCIHKKSLITDIALVSQQ